MREPNLLEGGQGRSDAEMHRRWPVFAAFALLLFSWLIVFAIVRVFLH